MKQKRPPEELSVSELEQLLYRKKRSERRQRIQRLKEAGRVVDLAGLPPPNPTPPPLIRPNAVPTGAMRESALLFDEVEDVEDENLNDEPRWRWVANKALLLVEITAVIGLAIVLANLRRTQSELNQELAQAQQADVLQLTLPTPTAKPVIDVAILPTGHRYIEGRIPIAEESGDIPAHLLPSINAYEPPPPPQFASLEQARRIQIPAIGVDNSIFEGVYDWEQLKKGVGHQIDSAQPGQKGNMVFAAHNDIYGEIFRHLDQLSAGDEIIISTERQTYTYIVNQIKKVDPVEGLWVMGPTEHASTTLISCYPYRVNNLRIVVFADLVNETDLQ